MTPTELRDLFDDESWLHRMTSTAPPVTWNLTERTVGLRVIYEIDPDKEPPDRIGQSLSGEMVALIAGIRADFTSYGPRHPVRRAMTQWERACRRRHRPGPGLQWRDHAHGPLCGQLLDAVIRGRASILWCAITFEVPFPRAERLLLAGLRYVSDQVAQAQDAQLGIRHDRERCDACIQVDRDVYHDV